VRATADVEVAHGPRRHRLRTAVARGHLPEDEVGRPAFDNAVPLSVAGPGASAVVSDDECAVMTLDHDVAAAAVDHAIAECLGADGGRGDRSQAQTQCEGDKEGEREADDGGHSSHGRIPKVVCRDAARHDRPDGVRERGEIAGNRPQTAAISRHFT